LVRNRRSDAIAIFGRLVTSTPLNLPVRFGKFQRAEQNT